MGSTATKGTATGAEDPGPPGEDPGTDAGAAGEIQAAAEGSPPAEAERGAGGAGLTLALGLAAGATAAALALVRRLTRD